MPNAVLERIDTLAPEVVALQRALVAIPALGPDNDGQGETAKAELLVRTLRDMGITDIARLDAPDARVPGGLRPNILARIPGRDASRTLWIISHVDIVPPGNPELWASDPYELKVDGDFLTGRGVEDNHGGIVPSLVLAKALLDTGTTPPITLGLLLVADEETGSAYGLGHVVGNHAELFGPRDLFLVPDFGVPDSSLVEVAEKSMLWLKVEVFGRQCHASTPEQGVNTLVAAADFILRTRRLHDEFPATDPLFTPPHSTFSPTRKDANVPNVNTIPGHDVFYVDCRVLPGYAVADVLEAFGRIAAEIEAEHGVRVALAPVQAEQAAPATPVDSEIVRRLTPAIEAVYGVTPAPAGIGGGTVAAILRRAGREAVVWSTCEHFAHQPNERSRISTQLGDAKVMARVLFA